MSASVSMCNRQTDRPCQYPVSRGRLRKRSRQRMKCEYLDDGQLIGHTQARTPTRHGCADRPTCQVAGRVHFSCFWLVEPSYIRVIYTSTIAFSRSWVREKRKWSRSIRMTLETTGCWRLRKSTTSYVSRRRVAASLLLSLRLAGRRFYSAYMESTVNSKSSRLEKTLHIVGTMEEAGVSRWLPVSLVSIWDSSINHLESWIGSQQGILVDIMCFLRTIFLMLCQLLNKRICYVRTGIALRLSEWETLRKVVVDDVRRNHPIVANFTPCFLNEDHTTVEGMQTCRTKVDLATR